MKQSFFYKLMVAACVAIMAGCAGQTSQEGMNRKPGNYPGNPDEWTAPQLVTDRVYRNVAKLRAATASSSFDYNLTAQLVTDDIVADNMPPTTRVFTQAGELPRHQKEILFDSTLLHVFYEVLLFFPLLLGKDFEIAFVIVRAACYDDAGIFLKVQFGIVIGGKRNPSFGIDPVFLSSEECLSKF